MFNNKSQNRLFVDDEIRANSMLVIDIEGKNLGVLSYKDAIEIAKEQGLNLVQISNSSPPTCKILDYGKYAYEESKRIKSQQKKQRESQINEKEIIFKPDTALNDLKIKAKKALEFLNDGDRVKITVKCTKREITHTSVINERVNMFLALIPNITATSINNDNRGKISYIISRSV